MLKPARFYSIVIPLFNKSRYVKKTIESILGQAYPHFELIIVDDGSTDGSIRIIEGFLYDILISSITARSYLRYRVR